MYSAANFSILFIVPTLDSCELLPTLVNSLQMQSWPYWRLLFVDGPSSPCHRDWLNKCCDSDPRCSWVEQPSDQPGIFGAMNHGFSFAKPEDWILFWGSDDWAAAPDVLEIVIKSMNSANRLTDLIVCKGSYAESFASVPGRVTRFHSKGVLSGSQYRRALWFGSTPPHQATLFGPSARSKLNHYTAGYRLSADLDYFLKLSSFSDISVQCLDLELVYMADGGVSGKQTRRRLQEVSLAYRRAYGWCWFFPFLARYARRLASLVTTI